MAQCEHEGGRLVGPLTNTIKHSFPLGISREEFYEYTSLESSHLPCKVRARAAQVGHY